LVIHVPKDILNITHNKLKLTKSTRGWGYVASLKIASYKNKSFKLNVHYETKTDLIILQNSEASVQLNEGINIIPIIDITHNINFSILYGTTAEIELLPEYPDALVFDGVDDYGINENVPILTDFTVIAKRKFINNGKGALLSKANDTKSAFVFEGGDLFQTKIWSFGGDNNIDVISDDISYMTTLSYNGISLYKGTITDTNKIFLGRYRYWQGAFYSAYLFDRSLDEQEIKEFIRKYIDPEYLLPSEQTTE
jgi:hypothetical protein